MQQFSLFAMMMNVFKHQMTNARQLLAEVDAPASMPDAGLQIWVRLPNQSQVSVEISSTATVGNVLNDPQLIEYKSAYDLSFGGERLPNDVVLSDAGICMESALDFTMKDMFHWMTFDPDGDTQIAVCEGGKLAKYPGDEPDGEAVKMTIEEEVGRGDKISMQFEIKFAEQSTRKIKIALISKEVYGFITPIEFVVSEKKEHFKIDVDCLGQGGGQFEVNLEGEHHRQVKLLPEWVLDAGPYRIAITKGMEKGDTARIVYEEQF